MRILAKPAYANRASNPYNWLLYSHLTNRGATVHEYSRERLLHGEYAILHLHWPEACLNVRRTGLALSGFLEQAHLVEQVRRRGTRIVWTIHNLHTHEGLHPRLEPWLWRTFIRRIDALISPSRSGLEAARERFPRLRDVPSFLVPLGHFRDVYPNALDRDIARDMLGIPAHSRVISFVGQIRPYKNVPALLRAFRGLDDPDARLLVAGKPLWLQLARDIEAAAGGDARIRLHLRHTAGEDLQLFLNAADVVVLPFREVLNSASALLALSFDRPILVPRKGALEELQKDLGAGWVRTFSGELTSGELAEALQWATCSSRQGGAPLHRFDWPDLAAKTLEAYQTVSGPG